jgi:hypothetical protein
MALFHWEKVATTIKRYISNIAEALSYAECTLEELEDKPIAEGFIYAQCRKCGLKDCPEIASGKSGHSIRYLYRRDGIQKHLPHEEAMELLPLVRNRVRKESAQRIVEKYGGKFERLCGYLERIDAGINKLVSRQFKYG